MWKLLENGDKLEVKDRLMHRIIFGDEDETSKQEFEIIAVEKKYYSAKLIKLNKKPVPVEYQYSWFKEIAKLSESKLHIWREKK